MAGRHGDGVTRRNGDAEIRDWKSEVGSQRSEVGDRTTEGVGLATVPTKKRATASLQQVNWEIRELENWGISALEN
jgi:hypothetical protein